MEKLKPCPFCGGPVRLQLCDHEGNPHEDDYLNDPYSGIGYHIVHSAKDVPEEKDGDCPIATADEDEHLGHYIYYTKQAAIELWNKREQGGNEEWKA